MSNSHSHRFRGKIDPPLRKLLTIDLANGEQVTLHLNELNEETIQWLTYDIVKLTDRITVAAAKARDMMVGIK
jgi:hypothetical protein